MQTNLRDTGDTLSRQMASMYRNFQKVKEDDTVSGDDNDSGDSGDDMMRDKSCVDTEDDVNQMTDLDADESSISSRKGPLPKGQIAHLQRKKAAQNSKEQSSRNAGNKARGQNNQRGQNNGQRSRNINSRDTNDNDVSSDITTTRNKSDIPQSGMDGDVEDDEDTMSESECSGNCLCCSSIASYQGIPWTIRRPSSAETTEYDSDSSECSDYEDDRYRARRTPLHARLSPFFHEEDSQSDSSSPIEEEVKKEGNQIPNKRMSPLGCESPSKSDASSEGGKNLKAPAKGAKGGPPKPAPKPPSKPGASAGKPTKPQGGKEAVKPPVEKKPSSQKPLKPLDAPPKGKKEKAPKPDIKPKEKREKTPKQEVSLSEAVALGAVARSDKSSTASAPKKTNEDNTEPSKAKTKHVSKTAIVLLDPEAEFRDGETIRKRSNILPQQQPIEVPLSYVDKNGRITLTPDPKLAPEAYKAGKTITFRVRAATDTSSINPDGSMVFTPSVDTKPKVARPVIRVDTTDSPPVSISAEEIGHEHQIQVSPEGIIRLSKRKPVPMQVFMPQFLQQPPARKESTTITLTDSGSTPAREHASCPSCNRKVRTTFVQPIQSSNVAGNVRVVRMSPGITPSPIPPQTQNRVHVIQRQDSAGHASPPMERQHFVIRQEPQQRQNQQHIIIKQEDPGQMRFQVHPEQGYPQVQQQVVYPQQEVYQQQGYMQPGGYTQQVYQQGYTQPGHPQIITTPSGSIRFQGEGISIPLQPGTQTVQRQVIHQPSQPSGGSGITTIRFGNGAPIKVQPGQGMRFVINPK